MEPLYHVESWEIEIEWKRPKKYKRVIEEGSVHDDSANLYLISARYGSANTKAIYIGKTWAQWVSKRLTQLDHKKRYAAFVKNYPRHAFYVSHGIVVINDGRLTKKRLDDIERILVYTNEPDHAHNVRNFYEHGVTGSYEIYNRGSRCTLPKFIALGVFVRY